MTDLQTRLTDANPVSGDDLAPSFENVWLRFESMPAPRRQSRRGLQLTTAPGHRRRVARWAMVGVVAVAVAVVVLVLGTTGGGPPKAFAGWSATPTTPATGQLQAAQSACQHDDPALASLTPTVADTRGPFSMLVYIESTATTVCTNGMPGGLVIGVSGGGTADTPSVAPDQIGVEPSGAREADGQGFSDLAGPIGADVTGVTLVLDDGSTVEATTASGWYVAWWPGLQGVTSAEITTAGGTSTQQLNLPGTSTPGASGDATRTTTNAITRTTTN
jgi:hypothetical protein